jgi:type I restriction enzyme, S subunit
MSKKVSVNINELGNTVTGKTPSSSKPEDFGCLYMFVTPSDNFDSKYILKTERYLSEDGYNRLISKALPIGSVLVTCIGSAMGKVALNKTSCISNQQINSIIVDDKKFNNEYIYYTLKNNYKKLRNASAGSTALPLLNKTEFDKIKIDVHADLSIQKKIASVLSALDSKIEINNRINSELESMAKTLYDYWFVQFDFPDKNGKPYKSSGGKMVYNKELKRDIPEGWEVEKLCQVAKVIAGGDKPDSFSIEKTIENNIPIYSNGIENDGLYGYTNKAKVTKQSVTISARGTIGYTVLRNKPFVPIIRLIVITPNDVKHAYFIYEYIKSIGFGKSGSVQQQLTSPMVSNIKILCPAEYLIEKFNNLTISYTNTIEIIKEQNQQLAELRDWLLPMLMNGQVKVK